MLSRKNSSIALSLLASAFLFAGCIIKGGDIDDPDPDPTGNNNTTQSTTTGTGGAGGESTGVGGAGGMGGMGGMGGSGGSSACIGPDGSGLDSKSCDNMNITPAPVGAASSICEPNGGTAGKDPPPGYGVCQHGFTVFNGGPAEHLQKCLAQIGVEPANACDPMQVQTCVNKMYEATCAVESVTKYCEDNAKLCETVGQTLKADQCAYELKPFNSATLGKYEMCFNNADPSLTCQQAHDECYVTQLSP